MTEPAPMPSPQPLTYSEPPAPVPRHRPVATGTATLLLLQGLCAAAGGWSALAGCRGSLPPPPGEAHLDREGEEPEGPGAREASLADLARARSPRDAKASDSSASDDGASESSASDGPPGTGSDKLSSSWQGCVGQEAEAAACRALGSGFAYGPLPYVYCKGVPPPPDDYARHVDSVRDAPCVCIDVELLSRRRASCGQVP